MKGRRQARRAALQALYELDLTRHELEVVLEERIENLCETAMTGLGASSSERAAFGYVWGLDPGHTASNGVADGVAERFDLAHDRAATLVMLAQRLREQASYAAAIVRGVAANVTDIDRAIARIAPEWPVPQMAPVDRNVLRIALWEMAGGSVPPRVIINEAVELARQFSGEGARRMVNGALGTYVSGAFRLELAPVLAVPREAPMDPG